MNCIGFQEGGIVFWLEFFVVLEGGGGWQTYSRTSLRLPGRTCHGKLVSGFAWVFDARETSRSERERWEMSSYDADEFVEHFGGFARAMN